MSDFAVDRAFEREMKILDDEYERGDLSVDEYNKAVRDLERSADEEETRYEDERGRW